MKNILISVVLSAVVAGCVAWLVAPAAVSTAVSTAYGAAITHIEGLDIIKGPLTLSNPNATSTTATSETLQQSDISTYTAMLMSPVTNSLTLTLPASSTLTAFIPKAGDVQSMAIVNVGTTSASTATLTFAGGTGVNLGSATSTKAIAAGKVGIMTFVRKVNGDIAVFFDIAL